MKNKSLRFGFFSIVVLMLAVGVFALSFHAHAAAPTAVKTSTTAHVSIVRNSSGVVFGKTAITLTLGTSFEFLNRTAVSQTVVHSKKTQVTIAAKSSAPYNFTRRGTFTFTLASNSSATLTVTVQ